MPLPMGEVAERSEDGEGKQGCNALSVTFGDSSPKGGAKGLYLILYYFLIKIFDFNQEGIAYWRCLFCDL